MKKFLNINTILIGAVLLFGIVGIIYMNSKNAGGQVLVQIDKTGESMTIPLNKDEIYHIDADLPVTLHVENGEIWFADSQCKDHICEAYGHISHENEVAICLPAGVAILVEKE